MAAPDFLCARVRDGTNMLTGAMLGGSIFEQFGQDLAGDDSPMAGKKHHVSSVIRFAGRWWCVSRSRIYVYNVDTRRWQLSLEPQGIPSLSNAQGPYVDGNFYGTYSGLFVANAGTNNRALYYGYVNRSFPYNHVFWRFDPTTPNIGQRDGRPYGRWFVTNGAQQTSGPEMFAVQRFHRGVAYSRNWLAGQTGDATHTALDGGVSNLDTATNPIRSYCHPTFFSLDDRMFVIAPSFSNTVAVQGHNVEELIGGVWSDRNADGWAHDFVGFFHGGVNEQGGAALGVLRLGDAVFVFGGGNNIGTTTTDSGLLAIKLTIPTPGGPLVFDDVTDPVIPAAYRPQVGGGLIGGGNGGARESYVVGFVDDETDPANPTGYVSFSGNDAGQGSPGNTTLFQFNGELAAMTKLVDPQGTAAFSYPDAPYGMGQYLHAPPTAQPLLEAYLEGPGDPGVNGVRLRYRLAGDPLLLEFVDNDLRLRHGVVSSGPFVVGETVTGATSLQVGVVTVVNANDIEITYLPPEDSSSEGFRLGEIITGGTSGATAITNVEHWPAWSGGPFTPTADVTLGFGGSLRGVIVTVNADNFTVTQVAADFGSEMEGKNIIGEFGALAQTRQHGAASGRFEERETVTGGTSGATGVIDRAHSSSVQLGDVTGAFQSGETITGSTSGTTRVLSTILSHGLVNNGPFEVGETVTGGTSGATGVVTRAREDWNGYGTYIALTSIATGPFVSGEVMTGGTSGATATTSTGELVGLGGGATHTVRFRYHLGAGPTGVGTPNSAGGICTLIAGSATGGSSIVNGNDVENVTADNRTVYAAEWDFVTDGITKAQVIKVKAEAVRI